MHKLNMICTHFQMEQQPRRCPLIAEAVDGKGWVVVENKFDNIDTSINSIDELEATTKAFIAKAEFSPVFHHAILSERGYPLTTLPSEKVKGMSLKSTRKQAVVYRPVEANSTKTVVDSTPESKLHCYMEKWVDVNINQKSDIKYRIKGIAIIKSEPKADEQVRHHDSAAMHDPDLMYSPDVSIMIPITERGNLMGWDNSHHVVYASDKAKNLEKGMNISVVRKSVPPHVDIHKLEKREIFYGTNEVLLMVGCFMHGGAPNHMRKPVYRLHAYLVRENYASLTKYTHVPSETMWDLTRAGANSRDFFLKDTQCDLTDVGEESSEDEAIMRKPDKKDTQQAKKAEPKSKSGTSSDRDEGAKRGPGRPAGKKRRVN